MAKRHQLETTSRNQLVDITPAVQHAVSDSGCGEGVCVVYCPHTTAGLTMNEGADPAVAEDILARLEMLVPAGNRYRHLEGNADSHIKAALVGNSVSIPVDGGKLALGAWQRIFFCEFDGPRRRSVSITILPAPDHR